MRNKRILILSFLILFFIVGFSVSQLGEDKQSKIVAYQELASTIKDDTSEQDEIKELINYYNNTDIQGKIIIDGTGIDKLILKSTNNDYYLNHNEKKEYYGLGSITQDYRTSLNDRKVLIYGHSSIYKYTAFNELENYYDNDFYKDHKYIKIVTPDITYNYEIFSVYVETSDFSYVNLNIDENTYNEHLKKYKERSLYDTGVEVSDNEDILILQTCSNNSKYKKYKRKYLLVIAKKMKED